MSDRGVFAVDRGIFTDDMFADEPLTEREAWLWIIAEAAWKARRTRVGVTTVDLKRGQLCHSVRFMAEAWRWSKSSVDRFLTKLEKRDAIARTSGTATSVITVCRYDEFQRVCLPQRDSDGTDGGTAAGQQRDKLENIKTLIPSLSEADASDEGDGDLLKGLEAEAKGNGADEAAKTAGKRKRTAYPEAFEALWAAYPTDANMSKQETLKVWQKLDETDRGLLMASVAPFKAWVAKQGDYRVVHLERYIKWRRFEGFAAKAASPASSAAAPATEPHPYAGWSDDRWRREVLSWRARCGDWPWKKSAPPDDPRTAVPRHILAEMNIHPARARAA